MASKRRIRRKACDGKRKFNTVAEANKVMFPIMRREDFKQRMNVYKCRFCKKYHFGHSRKYVNE